MPRPTKGARLGGSASHQKHILANLACSLFEHGRITTTEAKARRLRPYAEKLITHAKNGTLAHRREVLKSIPNKDIVHVLFTEIAPIFSAREGGYTRIIKIENRKGDNAPMAIIELVRGELVTSEASRATRAAASKAKSQAETQAEKPAESETPAEVTADNTADAQTLATEEISENNQAEETSSVEADTAPSTDAEVSKEAPVETVQESAEQE